jgi:hypothetical protein
MMISWLVLDFFIELPGTYYPLYVEALGGTVTTIGLIGSVSLIAAAVVQIPGVSSRTSMAGNGSSSQ